jgi:hypothetical protein
MARYAIDLPADDLRHVRLFLPSRGGKKLTNNPQTGSGKSMLSKTVVAQFTSFIRLPIDVYI